MALLSSFRPTFRTLKTQFGVNFCLPWQPKDVFRDAEQGESLALQIRKLDVEDLNGVAVVHELVPLGEAEQTQDLFRGGSRAVALLGIERQFADVIALHGKAQLALDDGLHEECEKIEREE